MTAFHGDAAAIESVILGFANRQYRWTELEVNGRSTSSWAHHGVAVADDWTVITGHPDGDRLVFTPLASGSSFTVSIDVTECHGVTLVKDDGEERIWIADNGHKYLPDRPLYGEKRIPGQVIQVGRDGTTYRRLDPPMIGDRAEAGWAPCAIAVDEFMVGGNGMIWVADGYGHSLVHGFAADGDLLITLDGAASGKKFDVPHGIIIDRRRPTPELVVADRGNTRLVAFDLTGRFLRTFGGHLLTSPSGLAMDGDHLLVTELYGGLVAFDINDHNVGRVPQLSDHSRPGWPNRIVDNRLIAPALSPGSLNSPHGIAVTRDGMIVLTEWCIGGRISLLTPIATDSYTTSSSASVEEDVRIVP